MKCIVFGCTNHTEQGSFTNDLCNPCYQMLVTGKIGPTDSFLALRNWGLSLGAKQNAILAVKTKLAEWTAQIPCQCQEVCRKRTAHRAEALRILGATLQELTNAPVYPL